MIFFKKKKDGVKQDSESATPLSPELTSALDEFGVPFAVNRLESLREENKTLRTLLLGIFLVLVLMVFFLMSAYSSRDELPIYIYDTSAGQIGVANPGKYTLSAIVSSVSRAVRSLNTWTYKTYKGNIIALRSLLDDSYKKQLLAIGDKRVNIWKVDKYERKLEIIRQFWEQDEQGEPIKYKRGMSSWKVLFTVLVSSYKNGELSSQKEMDIAVQCDAHPPTLDHPHGFVIRSVNKINRAEVGAE